MAMQGIPVAEVSTVPKINAIDKIDSLTSPLSKKKFSSRTKGEAHSFAKILARAQGKKIAAQVSDAFSGAGLSAHGKSEILWRGGGKSAHDGAFDAIRSGSGERVSVRNAESDMRTGGNAFRESKRAPAELGREDASKAKALRSADADSGAVKESKAESVKDVVKKETDDGVVSDFNERNSPERTQNESVERKADSADAALEKAEEVDAGDESRAALLEDFFYRIDGAADAVRAREESGEERKIDTDDFFAESISVSEDAVPFQIGTLPVYAAEASYDKSENGGFSDEEAFPFEINGDAALSKRERSFDEDGRIFVTDLRTETAESLSEVKPETEKLIKIDASGESSSEMTMFVADGIRQNTAPANAQRAPAASSSFQAMLANQIRQNASDFVKAGSIVLRDNNAGTINLVLRPESLGNVKISLQLSDKVVSGQITVHSEEAYNAFKESAGALRNAFAQSGFEAGGFTVAYSSTGAGGSFSGSGAGGGFANAEYAGRYEDVFVPEGSTVSGGSYIAGEHAVNVVA